MKTYDQIVASLVEHGIDLASATIRDERTRNGNGAVTVSVGKRQARHYEPNNTWSLKISGRYVNDVDYPSAGAALSAEIG